MLKLYLGLLFNDSFKSGTHPEFFSEREGGGGGAGADPGIYVLARASLRTAPGHAFILRILMTTKRCKENN